MSYITFILTDLFIYLNQNDNSKNIVFNKFGYIKSERHATVLGRRNRNYL